MATKLVIVESPTKAHKIGDYLGKGYTVMASVGHIRDLAQPSQVPAADKAKFGKFGVDVNDGFKPYYIVDGDKKRTVTGSNPVGGTTNNSLELLRQAKLGCGVIGNTADSGSAILGSSPGIPANDPRGMRGFFVFREVAA